MYVQTRVLAVLAAILGLSLAACASGAATEATSPLSTPTSAVQVPEEAEEAVAGARQDLAARLGLSPDQIQVVSVRAVDWPDTSLGCPQPGMSYAQVITPGWLIILEAGSERYELHTGGGTWVLCDDAQGAAPPAPSPPPQATPTVATALPSEAGEAVDAVRQDLAARRDLSPDRIEVVSVRAVDWPDTSLGCPQPGMSYAQVITPGYLITLEADGERYELHTGGGTWVLCDDAREAGPPAPSPAPQATPTATTGSAGQAPGKAEEVVEAVRQDLAARLDLSPDQIQVVSVEAVDWSDTSLGCPQPGRGYAPVITPGYLIILRTQGERYEYHTGGGTWVLCQEASTGPAGPTSFPPDVQALIDLAKKDLSQRLDVPIETIQVESVEAVEWPDTSLGCPKPGFQYLDVVTPGYRIQLGVGDQVYDYHTDDEHVVYCK